MTVISNTRGNPQASDIAVQTATSMLGGASREDLQTVISSADAELAKLFEDRNITLVGGGLITFTGTQLQFTENLELHINSRVAGGSPQVISLASTTRTLSASGRMLYAVINRTAGTAVVTDDATSLAAVTSANQEVVLIAKRVDAGDGTQRCYFRQGSTYNAGQTARLGSSGSGSGSGEVNAISNPSDATNWVASGAGITVATTTTTSDLPLAGLVSTAIKITPVSGTDYARYRFTLPSALKSKKLKIEWFQHSLAGYLSGDLKLEMYKNSASDYSGSYTEFPLSTDVSGTSSIPAGDGRYTSTFDSDTADYYEMRIVRVSGTTALAVVNVVVGPGVQPQGSAVGEWQNYTPVGNDQWTANATYVGRWRRVGDTMEVFASVTAGPTIPTGGDTGGTRISLPAGFTIDTAKLTSGSANESALGTWQGSITGVGNMGGQVRKHTSNLQVELWTVAPGAADYKQSFDVLSASQITNAGGQQGKAFAHFTVPIAEWAGSGTLNTGSNNVEYVANSNTSTGASDTTSFSYGTAGAAIVAVSSAGATIKKRVRTQRPMGAGAGKPTLEVSPDGILWMSAESQFPYMEAATERYGMRMVAGGTALTDIDVEFGGDGANGTEAWSVYTSWKWRVTVAQPGVAVGFGLATATESGLMSAAAQDIGGNKNFTGKLNIGPAAGLGTGAAAYHTFKGSIVGDGGNAGGAARWGIATQDGLAFGSNVYRDGAASQKAIAAVQGYSQLLMLRATAVGGTALSLATNYTDVQTADATVVTTNQLVILTATAGGAFTFGDNSAVSGNLTHTLQSGGTTSVSVRSGTAATNALMIFQRVGTQDAFLGSVGANDSIVTGSLQSDLIIATTGGSRRILFSDTGSMIGGIMTASGAWTVGPSSAGATLTHNHFGHMHVGTSAAVIPHNMTNYRNFGNKKGSVILPDSVSPGDITLVAGTYYDGAVFKYATSNRNGCYFNITPAAAFSTAVGTFVVSDSVTGTADATVAFNTIGAFTAMGSWILGGSSSFTTTGHVLRGFNGSGVFNALMIANNATAAATIGVAIQFAQTGNSVLSEIQSIHQGSSLTDLVFKTQNGSLIETGRIGGAGNWTIGPNSLSANVSQTINGFHSSAGQSALNVVNLDATVTTAFAARFIKGNADTTTAHRLIGFQVNAGATNQGMITANGANAAAFGSFSDIRLKENIEDLPSQLANIMALRPVEFDYIAGGHQTGFIAQEMQLIYPDSVGSDDSEEGMLTISGWDKTTARLVKAIQEIAIKLEDLQADYDAYKDSHP